MVVVPYTNNINEVENMYNDSDGILVIANPEEELVKESSTQIKEDKYKDLDLKIMDYKDANLKPENALGVINVIKNGKVMAHYKFDRNNQAESLFNHVLKIYNAESYKLNDNKLDGLNNIIDFTKVKVENNEESKKFFDYEPNDKNTQQCKTPGNSVNIESFNITDTNCIYADKQSGLQDSIEMFNNSLYSENNFENDLFSKNNIQDTKYEIKANSNNLMSYPLSFNIKK